TSTLATLMEELIKSKGLSQGISLSAEIQDVNERQAVGDLPLISVEEAKKTGALWVGLEITPVFRDKNKHLYPIFFRQFRDYLINAAQKAVFDFIRVQTKDPILTYHALGRKSLKQKVFEIDNQLAKIEKSFQFLWLVAPVNIQHIKQTF